MLYRAGFATAAAAAALAFAPAAAQAQGCGEIELGAAVSATGIYAANGNNTKNGYEFPNGQTNLPFVIVQNKPGGKVDIVYPKDAATGETVAPTPKR